MLYHVPSTYAQAGRSIRTSSGSIEVGRYMDVMYATIAQFRVSAPWS